MSAVQVANAPVSFGVFELTGGQGDLPDPIALLDAVADAGYTGIDLGPVGYLGDETQLPRRLEERGLGLAGAWVALRLGARDGFDQDLTELDRVLDVLDAARETVPGHPPRPTLADAGSPERRANPGGGVDRPDLRLDTGGWQRLADRLATATNRCRERGYEPTFHHHACTYVEAPDEIDDLLTYSEVGLCLDTGHVALGGGDPVVALHRWADRINHVHLKDVRLDVLRQVIDEQAGMRAVWQRGAFCELGTGDADVGAVLAVLSDIGYEGWLVVEQDRIPTPDEGLDAAAAAQRRNRAWLQERGL